jgi:hypothetical protein
VLVIVTEPETESPIFSAAELKIAPEPERHISSVPEAKAFDAIVVEAAVQLAKVPPIAATAITAVAARLRRIFERGSLLSILRVVLLVGDPLTIGPLRMQTASAYE